MLVTDYFVLILSIVLIVAVLLQNSTEDATSAFTGESSDLFKNRKLRGFDLFLNRTTMIAAILLFIFVVLSNGLDSFRPWD
ncbi:preprotein translocase subunit SecG [Acholeplasma sp. OttesenSCG-928-E16]|nr:preprotein translocase subunit SecG [Acholeplasma sp. OttesenSCG-928-E16]